MRVKLLAAVSIIAISVSGCSTIGGEAGPSPAAVRTAGEAQERADINPGFVTGSGNLDVGSAPELRQILAKTAKAPKKEDPKDKEDRLRKPAMQEAAMAYGARAGLSYASKEINKLLERRAAQLTQTYNFQKLMIKGEDGVMVTPPVIVEAVDTWETSDAGKTLRVADTVYEIVEQVSFASVTPMWQNYLIQHFDDAETPPDALLPQSEGEKEFWQRHVIEGWKKGEEQAEETFQANLNRLNRDFNGMIRYRQLAEEGKVSEVRLAGAALGNTGTGQDMRVNDKAIRITSDPTLNVNSNGWTASATTTENGEVKGPEKKSAPVMKAPDRPKKQWKARSKPIEKAPVQNVDKPTKGGDGRF